MKSQTAVKMNKIELQGTTRMNLRNIIMGEESKSQTSHSGDAIYTKLKANQNKTKPHTVYGYLSIFFKKSYLKAKKY